MDQYLHGRRIDVQAIAAQLGLGRATIYRWFGSRE
jgi:AcrR family transcriptional regulator